jgi:hypothetical protein
MERITIDQIEKWVKATIPLEAFFCNNTATKRLWDIVHSRDSSVTQTMRDSAYLLRQKLNPPRSMGSAVFLKHKNRHYLITAAHLLLDTTALNENQLPERIVLQKNIVGETPWLKIENKGGNNLFIEDSAAILTGITYTNYEGDRNYLFAADADLVIVGLDSAHITGEFIRKVYDAGYAPIQLSDIDTTFAAKQGDRVFTVGYPEIDQVIMEQQPVVSRFRPKTALQAIVSRGYVGDIRKGRRNFETDLFTFLGNSGGPIISRGRLIGIVEKIHLNSSITNDEKIAYSIGQWMNIKSTEVINLLNCFDVMKKKRFLFEEGCICR